jgi:hypothetical protein
MDRTAKNKVTKKEDRMNVDLPEQRNPIFFSEVEHTFSITGRGVVVVPALPRPDLDFRLRVKSLIQLRSPDGRIQDTYIAGVELLCGPKVKGRLAFLLPQEIEKQSVPKGTEIWLVSPSVIASRQPDHESLCSPAVLGLHND